MEEEDARLALLQTELNNLQGTIRNFDSIVFQIKGWCVTAALAIGGFAVTYHKPELLFVGESAIIGFLLIDCQFRLFQRRAHNRNYAIDAELKKAGLLQVLKGAGTLEITGTAIFDDGHIAAHASIIDRVRQNAPDFWFEAGRVSTFSLYAFLAACLLVEFIVLL